MVDNNNRRFSLHFCGNHIFFIHTDFFRLPSSNILISLKKCCRFYVKTFFIVENNNFINIGGPRYSRTFYLRIRLSTSRKRVKNSNCPVKDGLFIWKNFIKDAVQCRATQLQYLFYLLL